MGNPARKPKPRGRAEPARGAHKIWRPMIILLAASLTAAAVAFLFHLNGNM